MSRPLILWGVHPAHGPLPLKLAEWSRAEQRRRESEGWTCAVYAQGDAPTGLALVTAPKHDAEHTDGPTGAAANGWDLPWDESEDEDDDEPDAYEVWNATGEFPK